MIVLKFPCLGYLGLSDKLLLCRRSFLIRGQKLFLKQNIFPGNSKEWRNTVVGTENRSNIYSIYIRYLIQYLANSQIYITHREIVRSFITIVATEKGLHCVTKNKTIFPHIYESCNRTVIFNSSQYDKGLFIFTALIKLEITIVSTQMEYVILIL